MVFVWCYDGSKFLKLIIKIIKNNVLIAAMKLTQNSENLPYTPSLSLLRFCIAHPIEEFGQYLSN
jgi:hypothetical protein